MHLSTVDIANFRSFESLRVDLEAGLNVLVGRNGIGKTNLLYAIRHALGPSASRGDAVWLERDDFYKKGAADDTERTISITLTFSGLSEEQRAYFYEIVAFDLADINNSKAIIRFEASWPKGKRQASIKRTGGADTSEPSDVSSKILESLPVSFLPALRDAAAALTPGYRSRLAVLLRELAMRKKGDVEERIKQIYTQANADLEKEPLIEDTKKSLQATTKGLSGSDYTPSAIRAAEADFDRILKTLHIQLDGAPIGSIDAAGLGYSNVLYMAVVLEHLKDPQHDEVPLLLIEEPEAHLHPQLAMLLAEYLANDTPGISTPQTIVTTHSPTLAASVPPNIVKVLFSRGVGSTVVCNGISKAHLTEAENGEFQRMMDITRATLYFAKGVLLVEGISESLLLPVLAQRLGYQLSQLHIAVIPICGVAFGVFKKVLHDDVLGIPAALITDGDPPVPTDVAWKEAVPKREGDKYLLSERTKKLLADFEGHKTVQVGHSQVTLEYDLAEAGKDNAIVMAEVWEECFVGTPGTFNRTIIKGIGGGAPEKAIAAWRGICRAEHSGSKAEFAHRLAARLSQKGDNGEYAVAFAVPAYLKRAFTFLAERAQYS